MGLIKGRMGRSYKPLPIHEPQSTIGGLKIIIITLERYGSIVTTSLDIESCTNGLALTEFTIALRCVRACS